MGARTAKPRHDPIAFREPHRRTRGRSRWQIFPGDLDLTLGWKPETELAVVPIEDDVSSHALVGDDGMVRARPAGESWPVCEVKSALKDG
ncbi:hypothetical protein [Bradyrhizobium sp. 180]|uniref:hypothetical protein n=1 Tax=Bradyrhizobium sp. 180 TaxID=2782650 RepID=UPI001FF992E1|nr:hypothetical protein [Bradyrhizobium sp. 180]